MDSGSANSSFSCSSLTPGWRFDVFLSFRGTDTRKNFTDHLHTALVQSGINTFKDDKELPTGHEISSELLKAIQESRIAIVVFSKNYASSRWCLDELVIIMECKKVAGQLVLPVFYDVDPSDVRKQGGTFKAAFAGHEERFAAEIEKVERWRSALTEAANLSGWELQNVATGYEAKFIKNIVEKVLQEVNHTYMHVPKYVVGLDCHVEKLNSLLRTRTKDVLLVGIYGMGGIGKTTIAKYFYNSAFRQYEGSCFLANILEESSRPNGLVHLQQQLLSKLLKKKKVQIANIDTGVSLMKQRLGSKRVLIVLDDLDELNQLDSLAGDRCWFAKGSLVIITTRNRHLLDQAQLDVNYEVTELSYNETITLFSWHAFKGSVPLASYRGLLEEIVIYAGGLPLALEVLGSSLFKKPLAQWKSMLAKLEVIPHNKIQAKLKVSYEALDDDTVKDIFLDIACFLIGMGKEYAIKIFDACGFYGDAGISALVDRCLLKISDNQLIMHNLLRDMGRGIIRESFPKEPGKRTRLWHQDDVLDVLTNDKGTNAIEGIILDLATQTNFRARSFARMHNLRVLKINNVNLGGSFEGLFEELRWLCWHHCPLESLPSNLHLEKLVCLDMQESNLCTLWSGIKFLSNLKSMDLTGSRFLTTTPDFSGVRNLEELILYDCRSLSNIDPSIGLLDKLTSLEMAFCENLKRLPSTIGHLKVLETLNIEVCSNLEGLPEQLGDMKRLRSICANFSGIKKLPDSIGNLVQLTSLFLNCCKSLKGLPLSIGHLRSLELLCVSYCSNLEGLPEQLGEMKCIRSLSFVDCMRLGNLPTSISRSLKHLSLRSVDLSNCSKLELYASTGLLHNLESLHLANCNLSDGDIPDNLQGLSSLRCLDLSGNNFCSLCSSISELYHLKELELSGCRSLQSVIDLPPNLQKFCANGCTLLQRLPNLANLEHLEQIELKNCGCLVGIQGFENLSNLRSLILNNCSRLVEIPGLENLIYVRIINLEGCKSLEKIPNLSRLKNLMVLDLNRCSRLVKIQGLQNLEYVKRINLEGCSYSLSTAVLEYFLLQVPSQQVLSSALYLSRQDIPDCFEYQGTSSVSFDVLRDDSYHATIWLDYDREIRKSCDCYIEIHIHNKTDNSWTHRRFWCCEVGLCSCVIQILYAYRVKLGDSIEVSFDVTSTICDCRLKVQKCGVNLAHTLYNMVQQKRDSTDMGVTETCWI